MRLRRAGPYAVCRQTEPLRPVKARIERKATGVLSLNFPNAASARRPPELRAGVPLRRLRLLDRPLREGAEAPARVRLLLGRGGGGRRRSRIASLPRRDRPARDGLRGGGGPGGDDALRAAHRGEPQGFRRAPDLPRRPARVRLGGRQPGLRRRRGPRLRGDGEHALPLRRGDEERRRRDARPVDRPRRPRGLGPSLLHRLDRPGPGDDAALPLRRGALARASRGLGPGRDGACDPQRPGDRGAQDQRASEC